MDGNTQGKAFKCFYSYLFRLETNPSERKHTYVFLYGRAVPMSFQVNRGPTLKEPHRAFGLLVGLLSELTAGDIVSEGEESGTQLASVTGPLLPMSPPSRVSPCSNIY